MTGADDDLLTSAREAFRDRRYEAALELLHRADRSLRESRAAASLAKDCYLRMGEISAVLGEINRMLRHEDDDALRAQARFGLGRLIETDPDWLPSVPASVGDIGVADATILHLLKESLPYSETGFTFRSRMTLEAHRRAGWTPVVVTSLGFPWSKGVDAPAVEVVDGVTHHRLSSPFDEPVTKVPFDIVLQEQATATAPVVDEVAPAVIQAGTGFRGYDQALVGLAFARDRGIPFVYEVRGFQEQTWTTEVERSERGENYRRRRCREERCFAGADRIITIAEAMRADICDRGADPGKVFVVPNAVDTERFTPRERDEELADRLGLSGGPVIGYISNLGWREGIEVLLRGFAQLRQRLPDAQCLVVGDGPERDRLQALGDELDLGDSLVMPGHVPNEQIEDHYALFDLFVVPRVRDRASDLVTPLKPLEAMAMGLPLLVSDLPALREIAAPGERGRVFEPEDHHALAEAAGDMLTSPGDLAGLAEAGRDWVRSERTLESNVLRYRQALEGLL